MRKYLFLLTFVSACVTISGDEGLLSRLERLPLAVHSGDHPDSFSLGQRVVIPECCVLGELLMTATWESAHWRGNRLRLRGNVHDDSGESWPGIVVVVGRVVEERGTGSHVAEVVKRVRADERGRFELTVEMEQGLRLYLVSLGMMTTEYDLSSLVP